MDNNYSPVPPIGGKKMCQLKDFSSYFFFSKDILRGLYISRRLTNTFGILQQKTEKKGYLKCKLSCSNKTTKNTDNRSKRRKG